MRMIEKKMLRAIEQRRDWRQDNTRVSVSDIGADVYLHGHHIAFVALSGKLRVNKDTLSRWPTPTTKSRLRALGADVYTRNWITYLDGEQL